MRNSLRTFVAMYAHRDSRNGERFIPLSKRRVYFYDQKQSAMAVTRQIRRGVMGTNAKTAIYYLVMVAAFFFFYAAFRSRQEHYYVNNEDIALPEDKDILEKMHDVTGYQPIYEEKNVIDDNKNNSSEVMQENYLTSADWIEIDSRPIPSWYDDAKFGILVHWGIHSLPALQDVIPSEGTSKSKDIPLHSSYMKLAPKFTAEFFDPKDWSELFNRSGAKYVVMTSKHHDGFPLWPSKYSWNWNSVVVGPNRDLVGELAESIRNLTGLKFGLYHSLSEWYHPLYQLDKVNHFSTEDYVDSKLTPELREMVNNYKPDLLMTDGDAEAPDGYWKSTEFLKWLFNQSPVKEQVVINDRWGKGCQQKHGGFYTGPDRYNPGNVQDHKWETVYTIHRKSRNYRRKSSLSQFFTSKELVHELIKTVSLGGNMLLAVGPSHDGLISPLFQERLKDLGYWLGINGESIYNTRPWKVQNETNDIWFTQGKDRSDAITSPLYAIFLYWPEANQIVLSGLKAEPETVVTLFGFGELKWNQTSTGLQITFPPSKSIMNMVNGGRGDLAWAVRLENLNY